MRHVIKRKLPLAISLALAVATASAPAIAAEKSVNAAGLKLIFDESAQTLLSLQPDAAKGVDFLSYEHNSKREGPGYYQLGDIDLRVRQAGGAWQDYSSALQLQPVKTLTSSTALMHVDITSDLPGIPLNVSRTWSVDNNQLVLRFTLKNNTSDAVEIGGLGLAMVFDNILSGRELDEAHEKANYAEPYLGMDAGYVQVVRLNGKGPVLLVLPEENAPLTGWMPILGDTNEDSSPVIYNDPMVRTHTFEGFYDWMVFNKGFADNEWKGKKQWNEPRSLTLEPGESYDTAVRFALAPEVRQIEDTLSAQQRPVAVALPGYVVPKDLPAKLYLNSPSPVKSLVVEPANALTVKATSPQNGWAAYNVTGNQWGQSRVTITYEDNTVQTVHYFVSKGMAQAVSDLGEFLFDEQWFEGEDDPFKRGPSIMSYDNDTKDIVLQDQRVWIAGLSDEGGAGSWLAGIMKQLGQPDAEEIAQFERFYNEVIDGRLQVNEGEGKHGVKKSLFFYDPEALPDYKYNPDFDWTTWASWSKEQSDNLGRSFNYPHVAAAQWVLYRLARFNEGLVKTHPWQTYLQRAAETSIAMTELAPHYAQFGQMEGDVFVAILDDLYAEGMNALADKLKATMKARADHWSELAYPFGSEMPWDSTGQEEVYAWMRYFGNTPAAELTREVILGYDFTQPHWGYNGSARRFWDFLYAGKDSRIERQLHHYGSTINAIPLLDSFRRNPDDTYLLRVGYGGMMGGLTNIHEDGFASAAFHSFPDYMEFDPYTGDYGSSFFGHAFAIGSYLINDATFGWQGFGGLTKVTNNNTVTITPKDAFRNRVYIAPAKVWLTLDAGKFSAVTWHSDTGEITVTLDEATPYTPAAMLNIASFGQPYQPQEKQSKTAGRISLPLNKNTKTVLSLTSAAN